MCSIDPYDNICNKYGLNGGVMSGSVHDTKTLSINNMKAPDYIIESGNIS